MELDRNGLEVLDREESLRLLGTAALGRIAVTSAALPLVLPVNFRFDGRQVLIRTGAGTRLDAATDHAVVAFEVDFATFVMSLASSTLIHLGELTPPDAPAGHRDLPLAKQTIDILGMLAAKTRGNLTSDEAQLLEHLLYDLRLKYVDAKK